MPSSGDVPDAGRRQWRSYEVHVERLPGPALLQTIRWSHRIQGRQSAVRVRSSVAGLAELIRSFTASGLTIERITRLDPEVTREGWAEPAASPLASPIEGGASGSADEGRSG
jgi:hypothetical protein